MSQLNTKEAPASNFRFFQGDRVLWTIIAILAFISVLVVYSSTAKMAYGINPVDSSGGFLLVQLKFLILSVIILTAGSYISIKSYSRLSFLIYLIFVVATIAAWVFGSSTNGAARWINIFGFRFQPSEGLKIAIVFHLSKVLSQRQGNIKNLKIVPSFNPLKWNTKEQANIFSNGFLHVLCPVIVASAVVLPNHTSSAVLIFGISFIIMAISCIHWRELGKIVIIVAVALLGYKCMGLGRSETAGGRIDTWVETWTTDRSNIDVNDISDTERAMIAINNGKVFGVGAGQSAMRVEMIHPESDYAFAFFVEEYGFILAILLLMLYLWVFSRALMISEKSSDRMSKLLALSVGVLIIVQALLHFMVSTNLMPETGQNLPLVSRGGSSMLFTAMAFMMLLSISRDTERAEIQKEKQEAAAARMAEEPTE